MLNGFALYLGKDNRTLEVREFPIPEYSRMQQLMQYLDKHKEETITCANIRDAGFGEITGEIMYPTQPMGQSGYRELSDDDNFVINDKGVLDIIKRVYAYNNRKAAEKVDKNRLISIDYSGQNYYISVIKIEKCIEHFYQLADRLKESFSKVPGISFQIGEEEVKYGNLFFRILYKGRLFLILLGKFGGATILHVVMSKVQFPKWEITISSFEKTCHLYGKFNNINIPKATDNEVIQQVTAQYNDRLTKFIIIKKLVQEIFNEEVNVDDMDYDILRDCVIFNKDTEYKIIEKLLPKPISKDQTNFFKYTSLDTFMKMLENNTIRMNSLVAMNDTSETNILQNVIRNFKEPLESEADNYLSSNTHFITSFSCLEDSLPMWTQYGDKGRGVCLVFERGKLFNENELLTINYISKDNQTVKKMTRFQESLKDKNINFYFALLDKYRNFIKYDFYEPEDECRYLVIQDQNLKWTINNEYTLVAPYIERHLTIGNYKDSMQKNEFPFVLKKVILGPAMPNKKYNCWQINYIASKKGIINFSADESEIDNYR